MARSSLVLAILFQALLQARAEFGPYVDVGTPQPSSNYIVSATSTLVLPDYPPDNNDGAAISVWSGMGMSNGDLIQSIGSNVQCTCWSAFAYTLLNGETTPDGTGQDVGAKAAAYPGDHVTMAYAQDTSSGNYTQHVYLNGNLVSYLSTSNGAEAQGWGTALECNGEDTCGTVYAHTWIDTQIVLAQADPNYGSTRGSGDGATGGEMSTSDGGVTWDLTTINIPQFTY